MTKVEPPERRRRGYPVISSGVDMNFAAAQLTHSNLGGFGPDAGDEDVRFSGVGTYYGQPLDLVVRQLVESHCRCTLGCAPRARTSSPCERLKSPRGHLRSPPRPRVRPT